MLHYKLQEYTFFIVKKAFSFSNLIFLWAKKHYLFFILLFFAVISHKQWDSGGILSNSLAIATDAAHLLADLAGFMISLLAIYIAGRRSTQRWALSKHVFKFYWWIECRCGKVCQYFYTFYEYKFPSIINPIIIKIGMKLGQYWGTNF